MSKPRVFYSWLVMKSQYFNFDSFPFFFFDLSCTDKCSGVVSRLFISISTVFLLNSVHMVFPKTLLLGPGSVVLGTVLKSSHRTLSSVFVTLKYKQALSTLHLERQKKYIIPG